MTEQLQGCGNLTVRFLTFFFPPPGFLNNTLWGLKVWWRKEQGEGVKFLGTISILN